MKKSVIALILVLALVILVSPGIIGMLANRAVEQHTERAEIVSSEVTVSTERFDRGWFSSEGTHRVSLNEAVLSDDERALFAEFVGDPLPDLVIDTRIDHGLLPLASLGREQGSLKPGLGSAISKLSLEFPDGNRAELPGAIFSDIGLTGETRSRYELPAGNYEDLAWGDASFAVQVRPDSTRIEFDGKADRLDITASGDGRGLSGLAFAGAVTPTPHGFSTGNVDLTIDELKVRSPAGPVLPVGPVTLTQSSGIVDGKLSGRLDFDVAGGALAGMGDMSLKGALRIEDADADSMGRFVNAINGLPANAEPQLVLAYSEEALKDVFAGGMRIDVEQLDLALPTGVLATTLDINIPSTDRDSFTWPSLLLAAELDASLRIPESLYAMAVLMNPQLDQAIEMGVLVRDGDAYVMDAVYRKGLLTVNGAPMPIPLDGF
ncbi:MAG: DUF945 family protein [Pseudomonadota bacterium]